MTGPGDFSYVQDEMKRMAYEDMYAAITKADAWTDIAKEPSGAGFLYSRDPRMEQIHAALNSRMAHGCVRNAGLLFSMDPYIGRIHAALNDRVGHSGASIRSTMRFMQQLAPYASASVADRSAAAVGGSDPA
jgi:hypothetical protein